MSDHVHFAYKNDGVPTVEIDLSGVAEYLPQPAIDALQMAINRAISPLLTELSSLREVVGRQAKTAISQAERIDGLEDQQAINIQNWGIAFKVINETRDKVEDLETAPQKAGPGTIEQQEQIAALCFHSLSSSDFRFSTNGNGPLPVRLRRGMVGGGGVAFPKVRFRLLFICHRYPSPHVLCRYLSDVFVKFRPPFFTNTSAK